MTDARRPDLVPVARAEARVIKNAFRHAGIHVKTEPAPDGGIAFMYQKGVLLVRDKDLNRVLAIVAPPGRRFWIPFTRTAGSPRSDPGWRSGRRDPGIRAGGGRGHRGAGRLATPTAAGHPRTGGARAVRQPF